MCNNCLLVSDITDGLITFSTTPTVTNGATFCFRIPCQIKSQTPATALTANVIINGAITAIPVWDCIGNVLSTGGKLKTRTCYRAVFGNNPNHLLISEKR